MFVVSLVTWLLCRSLEKPPLKDVSQHNSDFEVDNQSQHLKVRLFPHRGRLFRFQLNPKAVLAINYKAALWRKILETHHYLDEHQSKKGLFIVADFELGDEDCELPEEEEVDVEDGELEEVDVEESTKMRILRQIADVASKLKEIVGNLITTAGKVVVTILLGLTGMMLPSLTSTVYFFTFLGLCTWWSFCRTFDPLLFSCLCVLMAIFSAGHLIMLYLYQFQFFQEAVPPGNSYASLFGISPVVQTDCSHTWMFRVNPKLEWHHFVNPIMLLEVKEKEGEAEEREEPESPESNTAVYTADKKRQLWRMAHYRTDERHLLTTQDGYTTPEVLIVTSNGASLDFTSVPHENGPKSVELYSTPHYRPGQLEPDPQKMDCGVYKIDSTYVELPEVPQPFGVVRVNAVVKAFRFIMKQSYICALIAMMAWSITYVSWLTFVFLIWSCILWMVRDRRKYSMITSPFMVFYGNLLIILQYIWSFESLQPVPGLFLKKEVPFRELGSKTLCLLSFWLLVRQFLTERREKQTDETQLSDVKVEGHTIECLEEEAGGHREMMDVLGRTVMAMLNKYWIYICGGMFFFVSFEGRIVMYKIIYMMMFLFCVALYQLHYERWRWMLKYFWMSVVVYTMLVLILVYTFQFESSINVWSNMTGMSREKLEDLGLEKFSVPALFTRIFIPTSFLLVCILHLHYFHERFLELTDIKSVADKQKSTISRLVHLDGSLVDISMVKPSFNSSINEEGIEEREELEKEEDDVKQREEEKISEPDFMPETFSCPMTADPLRNKWHLVVERLTVLFLKFLDYVQKLQLFIWWLLELHIIKIVSSYIIWVSVKEVSLFNYVFLVSWAFALPFSQFRPLASSVCTVWTCVIIVCKMLYQLTSINPSTYSKTCSMVSRSLALLSTRGTRKRSRSDRVCDSLLQPDNYTDAQRLDMAKSLLYSSPVDPANWIGLRKFSPLLENLRNNLLMLALLAFEVTIYRHQDFYRMKNNLTPPVTRTIFHNITRQHLDDGITCFLLAVNVIGQRMDFYAMLHAFGLIAVMYQRRRKAIAHVWSKYCCFLACMLAFQYLIMDSNVIKWLYFPDFHTKPNSLFLLYDFMLLLCASLQGRVFEEENLTAVQLLAGDNVEICRDLDAASFSQHNPVPDFIHCRSYLDMLKVIMFSYLFWFVLTIIFITGTTRISIFCMGYLVACFYFLIFGGELLLKPIKSILHYWDFLIAYNVFVISMKNILSIAACGYIKALVANHCWLIQLFSLACTIKGYSKPEQNANKQCELPSDEAGIIWDSICFAFLLLQRRVFMSYYFLHVVADIRSSQVLASRGAELFQATIVKAVKARIEEEKKSMDLLKRQMDRIKSRQQKFKRGKERMLSLAQESGESQSVVKEEEEEDEGENSKEKKKGKRKQWWKPWVDHASMVRSGNYYLFETDSEEEEEDEDKKDEEPPKRSAFQTTNCLLPVWKSGNGTSTDPHALTNPIPALSSLLESYPKSVIKLPKTVLQYVIRAAKYVSALSFTSIDGRRAPLHFPAPQLHNIHAFMTLTVTGEQTEPKWLMIAFARQSSGCHLNKGCVFLLCEQCNHAFFGRDLTPQSECLSFGAKHPLKLVSCLVYCVGISEVTLFLKQSVLPALLKAGTGLEQCASLYPACFVYHAWITDSKTAMKERSKERRRFWQRMTFMPGTLIRDSTGNIKHLIKPPLLQFVNGGSLCQLPPAVHVSIEEEEQEEGVTEEEASEGPDNILKRVFNIVKFSWVLFLALLDSFTAWLNSICQEHIDISTVLRIERCMLTHEVKKGNIPSRDSIHMYYQRQMCRPASTESILDRTEDVYSDFSPLQSQAYGTDGVESDVSRENLSSVYTESTVLCESTLDQADETSDCVLKTSQRARPRLCRLPSVDVQSSADSAASSERTQCTELYSRQGTGDTVEEAESHRELREHPDKLWSSTSDLPPPSPDRRMLQGAAASAEWDSILAAEQVCWTQGGADIPPSYSKATGLDSVCDAACRADGKKLRIQTPDDKSADTLLSVSHQLTASELLQSRMFYDEELEASEHFYRSQPQFLQLCYSLYNMLVAHSEMVCYLVIILNHMISASVATLVLPILIFLWAMLSVPRPSKRFWMTAIVYTEVTIVIKYFFQFGFFPFNQSIELDKSKPFHPPNIIGVEKKEGYVHYDLVQLLALFFHRSILKCYGLWDEDKPGSGGQTASSQHADSDSEEKAQSRPEKSPADVSPVSTHVRLPRKHLYANAAVHRQSSSISQRSARSKTGKSRKELVLEKLREQMIKAKRFTVKTVLDIYIPIRQFFYNLIHPEYSAVTDVYVLMFLADTKHSAAADITSSLSEDQVPEAFLVMVLIQFGTMVVDRALYLRKTVMGKVIFQVILVFGIHFWMFFILPGVTERRFSQNTVAQLWYFVKCIYFGLSAYQIRCGYPTRVLGNFLTKSYNYVNLFLFQGFRLVPFLTELRAVMDWVWTDTTLSLSSWICVEDIYAHIFVLKCWRESEKVRRLSSASVHQLFQPAFTMSVYGGVLVCFQRYPQPRGQKKKKVVKYGMGGMIVMLLICIVWFPLLFMSLVKSVAGVVNKPLDVSVTITLGGFQSALQFLEAYTAEDVTVAELEGSSNSLWTISPPSRKNLMDVLSKEDQFPVTMYWSIQRVIEQVFPCFIRAPSDSNAKPIDQLYTDDGYKSIQLDLERTHNGSEDIQEWWIVDQPSAGKIQMRSESKLEKKREAGLQLYVFSDKVSPPSLGFLAGYGIMGLYASVVLVIGKFVREFFSGISHSIMFEELPCVDRILKLCTDIFLVRETGELELEEDLYAKLIFLYRSPETMIKWTREKTK
ncbi:Piezo-type mechanosensitive ion channel component 2 [Labeo rohita]|uniref:Piezo-type mechanosensitive ion channel component 2 n=1 Tax=Labeo rohita TaxID=84645 RepID=A0ABQ8LI19_LABRO|nr:Piezo-type mechanosensitive ion channel component 2 [Labeo rohita]